MKLQLRTLLLGLMVVSAPALASHNLTDESMVGVSDDNRAQDLNACRQHFWRGVVPTIHGVSPVVDDGIDRSAFVHDGFAQSAVSHNSFVNLGQVAEGTPTIHDEWYPLCFSDFALVYSGTSRTAIYTAHHVYDDEVARAAKLDRRDSFRAEMFLPRRVQVSPEDYRGFDYDRGHLVPNGDMASRQAQYDSFSLANIIPQNREHNRGIWRQIEQKTRALAKEFGEVYVITGTAYHGEAVASMRGVLVPTHLYKAVYIPSKEYLAVYYAPNDASLSYELIDGRALFERTGVDVGVAGVFRPKVFEVENASTKETLDLAGWIEQLIIKLWQGLMA